MILISMLSVFKNSSINAFYAAYDFLSIKIFSAARVIQTASASGNLDAVNRLLKYPDVASNAGNDNNLALYNSINSVNNHNSDIAERLLQVSSVMQNLNTTSYQRNIFCVAKQRGFEFIARCEVFTNIIMKSLLERGIVTMDKLKGLTSENYNKLEKFWCVIIFLDEGLITLEYLQNLTIAECYILQQSSVIDLILYKKVSIDQVLQLSNAQQSLLTNDHIVSLIQQELVDILIIARLNNDQINLLLNSPKKVALINGMLVEVAD